MAQHQDTWTQLHILQESVDISLEVQERASQQAAETVFSWLSRSSCMVVGPGLGKDSVMIRSVYLIMQEIRKQVCTAALGLWFLAFRWFSP